MNMDIDNGCLKPLFETALANGVDLDSAARLALQALGDRFDAFEAGDAVEGLVAEELRRRGEPDASTAAQHVMARVFEAVRMDMIQRQASSDVLAERLAKVGEWVEARRREPGGEDAIAGILDVVDDLRAALFHLRVASDLSAADGRRRGQVRDLLREVLAAAVWRWFQMLHRPVVGLQLTVSDLQGSPLPDAEALWRFALGETDELPASRSLPSLNLVGAAGAPPRAKPQSVEPGPFKPPGDGGAA